MPRKPAKSDRPVRVRKSQPATPEAPQSREFLFDSVTGLPTLPLLVPDVRKMLTERKGVGVLTVNIAQFSKLEDVYGWETFDGIVRGVASCLKGLRDETLRRDDALAELTVNGNVFILLLSPPRKRRAITYKDVFRVKQRLLVRLEEYLIQKLNRELLRRFGLFIGCAVLHKDTSIRLERLMYRGIDEAMADADSEKHRALRGQIRELRSLLTRRRISTVYQPIVDLRTGTVFGYEALSRGPRGTLETPEHMFHVAYESELIWKLERLCRDRAMRHIARVGPEQLLFVNTEPTSIFDPRLAEEKLLRRYAARIVFEITERAAITDFPTLRQAVQILKSSGFRVALDDVGSAYSGLRLISEIKPDFIKLDMHLTRGADESAIKRQLIGAVARFCEEAGVALIVEGIETADELAAVEDLGIHLLQGYLFGPPASAPGKETVTFPRGGGQGEPPHEEPHVLRGLAP